jgi:hypothetical protein
VLRLVSTHTPELMHLPLLLLWLLLLLWCCCFELQHDDVAEHICQQQAGCIVRPL